jgi:glutaminase
MGGGDQRDGEAGEPDVLESFENVSTGWLPGSERVRALVHEAHERFVTVTDGTNSAVYPALERADPRRFGLCVVGADGRSFDVGDAAVPFTIMSVVKPFVFALVCEAIGADEARRRIGVNPTGLAFNSAAAVERSPGGRTNPMVNSGAIATTSLLPGGSAEEKWEHLSAALARFAGRELTVDSEVYTSASTTNHRNQAIARLLEAVGGIFWDPRETVELYTRACSLSVTAQDLAVMGATMANGGVNPITGEYVIAPATCHDVLAVMAVAGLYETSGDWLYQVGLPGKSGIGGGIMTVSPGKGGLATYSTPLDAAGNSVRGQLASQFLSRHLGLDLFVSARAGETPPAVP